MAREVVISQPGPGEARAKVRHPLGVLGLTFITFGIYGWVWWYGINWEMAQFGQARGRTDLGEKPVRSVLAYSIGGLLLVPAIWTYVATARRIQRTQVAVGLTPFSGWFFVLILILTLTIAGNPYLQSQLNKVWDSGGLEAGHADAEPVG